MTSAAWQMARRWRAGDARASLSDGNTARCRAPLARRGTRLRRIAALAQTGHMPDMAGLPRLALHPDSSAHSIAFL